MSFLDTLRQWDHGCTVADGQDFSGALQVFLAIQEPNSKIFFNIGCLHLLNEDLSAAEKVNFRSKLQTEGTEAQPRQNSFKSSQI